MVSISVQSEKGMGGHVTPSKSCLRPEQRKKICPPRQNSDKYRKKLNVFYTCSLWVRTAAILSYIFCSHYGFLHQLLKNNLFRTPITEQHSLIFINITTRQQFFISVRESTKTMLKQRLPNFFQIIFEIESMN